jgi:hypothetical protein
MAEDPVSVLERDLVRAARRRAMSATALAPSPLLRARAAQGIVIGSFSERREAQMRRQRRFGPTEATAVVALVVFIAALLLLLFV